MRITCSRCRTAECTVTLADTRPGVVELVPVALSTPTQIVHLMARRTDAAITVIDGFARRTTARGSDRHYRRGRGAETTDVSRESDDDRRWLSAELDR